MEPLIFNKCFLLGSFYKNSSKKGVIFGYLFCLFPLVTHKNDSYFFRSYLEKLKFKWDPANAFQKVVILGVHFYSRARVRARARAREALFGPIFGQFLLKSYLLMSLILKWVFKTVQFYICFSGKRVSKYPKMTHFWTIFAEIIPSHLTYLKLKFQYHKKNHNFLSVFRNFLMEMDFNILTFFEKEAG